MKAALFRSHETDLSDDELLLMDVMFDVKGVAPFMLRQCNFGPQFNARPHSLNDVELKQTVKSLVKRGLLEGQDFVLKGQRYIGMTKSGAGKWEIERRPDWNRYCTEREAAVIRGRTITSVCAVNPEVRDDFLRIAIQNPFRTKRKTINDLGLIPWKTFDQIHVGLASYIDSFDLAIDPYEAWQAMQIKTGLKIENERTWWRNVGELQRFVG